MNILQFGLSPNMGGIERSLLRLAQNIDRSRFQLDFIDIHHGRSAYRAQLEELGCKFYDLPARRDSPLKATAAWKAVFATGRYNLFHFHVNTLSYLAPMRAALRFGCPVIVHSRSSNAPRVWHTRALHHLNQKLTSWPRVERVAVSEQAGRWLFGSRVSFTTIPNGVDVEKFRFSPDWRTQTRERLGLREALVIGHVGAFLPVKNHRFIMKVFKEVVNLDSRALLVLVGDGQERPAVTEAVQRMGLGESVKFLGAISNVEQLLSAFDCFLFPSKYEGFGNAVVEAETSGLPCVVSEAVADSALVPGLSTKLSLLDDPLVWARALVSLGQMRADRFAAAQAVEDCGLGVDAETRSIERLYLRHSSDLHG